MRTRLFGFILLGIACVFSSTSVFAGKIKNLEKGRTPFEQRDLMKEAQDILDNKMDAQKKKIDAARAKLNALRDDKEGKKNFSEWSRSLTNLMVEETELTEELRELEGSAAEFKHKYFNDAMSEQLKRSEQVKKAVKKLAECPASEACTEEKTGILQVLATATATDPAKEPAYFLLPVEQKFEHLRNKNLSLRQNRQMLEHRYRDTIMAQFVQAKLERLLGSDEFCEAAHAKCEDPQRKKVYDLSRQFDPGLPRVKQTGKDLTH